MKSLVVLLDHDNDAPLKRAAGWLEPDGVLYLVGILRRPSGVSDALWPQASALLAVELSHQLEQALAATPLPDGACGETHVVAGDTARELSRLAARVKADAVVMDSAAMTSWRRLFAPPPALEMLKNGTDPLILIP